MLTAFEVRPLIPQSFMQRLLQQYPAENAVIELNNLLATRPVLSITRADLAAIEQQYGFSLSRYILNLEEFYAVQFNHKFVGNCLPKDSLSDLTHLQTLFQLPAESVEMLHTRIGEIIYRRWVTEAVQSDQISDTAKTAQAELRQMLSLPLGLADSIYNEVCQIRLAQFVQEYGDNARISPEEDVMLQNLSKRLGVRPSVATKRIVERFKRYWTIENTSLPVTEVPITLQKSEHSHYLVDGVQWYEERATARRANYDDHYEFNKSFDIIDLQSNNEPVRKDSFSVLKRINTGSLYLTNKRLVFESQQKSTSIKLNTIVQVKAYKQGILVDKLTGKSILLIFNSSPDILALICQRLIHSTSV